MIHRLLAAAFFLFAAPAVLAQVPPEPTEPPLLDQPDHWDIHGPNGALGFEIRAEFLFRDGNVDVYYLEITGEIGGQPYTNWALAFDGFFDDGVIDVYNNDSKLWTEWHWDVDHYLKVGGTSAVRTYHPVG